MKYKDIKKFIITKAKEYTSLTTWWCDPWFEDFTKFMNLDPEYILSNAKKIRYYLHKMEQEGILTSIYSGSGNSGVLDFGLITSKEWFIKDIVKQKGDLE